MKTKNWYDQVPGPSRLEMRNNDDDNDDENTRVDSFKIVFLYHDFIIRIVFSFHVIGREPTT